MLRADLVEVTWTYEEKDHSPRSMTGELNIRKHRCCAPTVEPLFSVPACHSVLRRSGAAAAEVGSWKSRSDRLFPGESRGFRNLSTKVLLLHSTGASRGQWDWC